MTDICQYCGSELQTNGCINPAVPREGTETGSLFPVPLHLQDQPHGWEAVHAGDPHGSLEEGM